MLRMKIIGTIKHSKSNPKICQLSLLKQRASSLENFFYAIRSQLTLYRLSSSRFGAKPRVEKYMRTLIFFIGIHLFLLRFPVTCCASSHWTILPFYSPITTLKRTSHTTGETASCKCWRGFKSNEVAGVVRVVQRVTIFVPRGRGIQTSRTGSTSKRKAVGLW